MTSRSNSDAPAADPADASDESLAPRHSSLALSLCSSGATASSGAAAPPSPPPPSARVPLVRSGSGRANRPPPSPDAADAAGGRTRLPKAQVFVRRCRSSGVAPPRDGAPAVAGGTAVPLSFVEDAPPRPWWAVDADGAADGDGGDRDAGADGAAPTSVRSAHATFASAAAAAVAPLAPRLADGGGRGRHASSVGPAVPRWAAADPWRPASPVGTPHPPCHPPAPAAADGHDDGAASLAEWPSYTQSAIGGCWGGAGDAPAARRRAAAAAAATAATAATAHPPAHPPAGGAPAAASDRVRRPPPALVPARHRRTGGAAAAAAADAAAAAVAGLDARPPWAVDTGRRRPLPPAKKQYRGRLLHRLLGRTWPAPAAPSAPSAPSAAVAAAAAAAAAAVAALPAGGGGGGKGAAADASAGGRRDSGAGSSVRAVSVCVDDFVAFVTAGAAAAADSRSGGGEGGRPPLRWLTRVGRGRRRVAAKAA